MPVVDPADDEVERGPGETPDMCLLGLDPDDIDMMLANAQA
jgi:hypothetical protein